MSRYSAVGRCDSCEAEFRYFLLDARANASVYAYCRDCGTTALASSPADAADAADRAGAIDVTEAGRLVPCDCGGRFTADAPPRCPSCRDPIDPGSARTWLEANSRIDGWTWCGSWQGSHAIVIENRVVPDALAPEKP